MNELLLHNTRSTESFLDFEKFATTRRGSEGNTATRRFPADGTRRSYRREEFTELLASASAALNGVRFVSASFSHAGEITFQKRPHFSALQGQLANLRSYGRRLPLQLNQLCLGLEQLSAFANNRLNDPQRSGADGASDLPVNGLWSLLGGLLDMLDRWNRSWGRTPGS